MREERRKTGTKERDEEGQRGCKRKEGRNEELMGL